MWRVRQCLTQSLQQISSWASTYSRGLTPYPWQYHGEQSSVPQTCPSPACQAMPHDPWDGSDLPGSFWEQVSSTQWVYSSSPLPCLVFPPSPAITEAARHWGHRRKEITAPCQGRSPSAGESQGESRQGESSSVCTLAPVQRWREASCC